MSARLRLFVAVGIPLAVVGVVLSRWPRRVAEYEDEHLTEWRHCA